MNKVFILKYLAIFAILLAGESSFPLLKMDIVSSPTLTNAKFMSLK